MFWYAVIMNFFTRLLERLRLNRPPKTQSYDISATLLDALHLVAEQQQRTPEELANSLLASGLASQSASGELWNKWLHLTPREQQVVALTCLGYTNPQMAACLMLSTETIRSHTRNVEHKLNIGTKADIRVLFAEWDFSDWEK
jgi:DNA-binding CsgD family transcriptional regulator